jgi:hypothetical protein
VDPDSPHLRLEGAPSKSKALVLETNAQECIQPQSVSLGSNRKRKASEESPERVESSRDAESRLAADTIVADPINGPEPTSVSENIALTERPEDALDELVYEVQRVKHLVGLYRDQ